jgi:peptide/nickel transport system permease protein
MKDRRDSMVRLAATAIAIVLIMFAVVGAFSTSHFTSVLRMSTGEAIAYFFLFLPRTIELIAVSFVVASTAGALSILPFARAAWPLIKGLALGLKCIPFFWLAVALEIALSLAGMNPISGTGGSDVAGHLSRLFAPAFVLAIYQFPLIVDYLDERLKVSAGFRPAGASLLGALGAQFARDLPDVLTATVVTEIVFAWPGDGRLFWHFLSFQAVSPAEGILLLTALSVLATRFLVATLTRRTAESADAHA